MIRTVELHVGTDEQLDLVSDFEPPAGRQLTQEVKLHAWFALLRWYLLLVMPNPLQYDIFL